LLLFSTVVKVNRPVTALPLVGISSATYAVGALEEAEAGATATMAPTDAVSERAARAATACCPTFFTNTSTPSPLVVRFGV
jgi:hypothetical protein